LKTEPLSVHCLPPDWPETAAQTPLFAAEVGRSKPPLLRSTAAQELQILQNGVLKLRNTFYQP
jgi:hypothetical protein